MKLRPRRETNISSSVVYTVPQYPALDLGRAHCWLALISTVLHLPRNYVCNVQKCTWDLGSLSLRLFLIRFERKTTTSWNNPLPGTPARQPAKQPSSAQLLVHPSFTRCAAGGGSYSSSFPSANIFTCERDAEGPGEEEEEDAVQIQCWWWWFRWTRN